MRRRTTKPVAHAVVSHRQGCEHSASNSQNDTIPNSSQRSHLTCPNVHLFTRYHGSHAPMVHTLPWFTCSHGSHAPMVHMLPWFTCSHGSHAPMVHTLPWFTCSHGSHAPMGGGLRAGGSPTTGTVTATAPEYLTWASEVHDAHTSVFM